MNELYRFSNQYYLQFESLKSFEKHKYWYVFGSLFTTIAFFTSFIIWSNTIFKGQSDNVFNLYFWGIVITEIVMGIVVFELKSKNKKYILKSISNSEKRNIKTIDEAKTIYLTRYFRCSQYEFVKISEQISKSIERSNKLSNKNSKIEVIFNFIYNIDANQRVLSLFVVLCSIILILSVNTGQNLYTVIETFSHSSFDSIRNLYFSVLFITLIVGIGSVFIFKILRNTLLYFSLVILARYERNLGTVKYLLADINNLGTFRMPINRKKLPALREKPNKAFKRN
ncbi:hypothetical protein MT391_03580 [Vibrio sp. 1-Bac 57]